MLCDVCNCMLCFCFFFFKQKTADELRISDWSSDVCSSDLPTKWSDLTDPKWKDKITVGHPGFSGYVGTWVVMMRKLYGWEYFEKLEENNPQIGRSINDTVTMLNAGERAIGAGPSATTLISASRGNPLGRSEEHTAALQSLMR